MKILIAGDFCPIGRVAEALEKDEYYLVLEEVCDITEIADYSIVNFECPVVTGNAKPLKKQGPNLKCTPKGIEAIQYSGFDCVTLANNHFLDYGGEGVRETLCILDNKGIDHVGGGMNLNEASRTLYKEINGKRLAIINCCEHEFSIATNDKAGSNPLNPVQQYNAIVEAKRKADYVIVIVHGGHEHFQLPSPRMVETYRFFIDAGADAVANHHQHCYSGYEVYNGKPIFYGLGNFCFDHPQKRQGIWTEGYMVVIDFMDANVSFKLIPYNQCSREAKVGILPERTYSERIESLNMIISNPEYLKKTIDDYYVSCADQYSRLLEPVRNKFVLGAIHHGRIPSLISKKRKLSAVNYICCESHRDKLIHWLLS